MQTTELLIQVRDALVALRAAMSLDYLVVLVFDMSRLMAAFCLFSAFISTDRVGLVVLLFIEYFRIVIGILLTRLGYHDLHAQVRRIRVANERQLIELAASANNVAFGAGSTLDHGDQPKQAYKLALDARRKQRQQQQQPLEESIQTQGYLNSSTSVSSASSTSLTSVTSVSYYPLNNSNKYNNNLDTANATCQILAAGLISRTEATTAYRLAREIEELWPTTWYTPDLRSYVSQNVFVFTFVATLQQLVEASAKVEYQGQHSLGSRSATQPDSLAVVASQAPARENMADRG